MNKVAHNILKTFGANLRAIREVKGITQMELAVRIDSSPNYVSRLENGHSEVGLIMLNQIMSALQCSFDDLMKRPNQ